MIEQSFGLALSDEDGRLTQVDRAVCELLGYEAPALLGQTMESLTHPDDWETCRLLLERLQAHDEPFSIAKRYLRRDGTSVWAQAYVTRLTDARGRITLSALIRPVLPAMGPATGLAVRPGIGCRMAAEAARFPVDLRPEGLLN